MTSERYAEIDSFQSIVDTFVDLTRNVHEVTLRFEGALIHYPVTIVSVDRTLGRCLVDITSVGDIERAVAPGQEFWLHARQVSAAVQTSEMRILELVHRSDRLGLRCDMPEKLVILRRRGHFRAALIDGMAVDVLLKHGNGREWPATLRDLSIGGCLLSMPASQARGLQAGTVRYCAQARFPNGETFEATSYITHMDTETEEAMVLLGVTFDIGLEKEAREVWQYVREVEREVARQASTRSEMRPLAASRLFSEAGPAKD